MKLPARLYGAVPPARRDPRGGKSRRYGVRVLLNQCAGLLDIDFTSFDFGIAWHVQAFF
jgi:hypothetical protein